ncbi:hypothetical protein FOPG_18625, partial [Fusarium oxysporum f. sp. conglutinans race 2 54008]
GQHCGGYAEPQIETDDGALSGDLEAMRDQWAQMPSFSLHRISAA